MWPPPTDLHDLDRYVLDLVHGWRARHDRFDVSEIAYVRTSRAAATGGAAVVPNPGVYLIQVSGRFTVPAHSRRHGARPRSGEVSLPSCTIDARSGRRLDGGWGGRAIDMSALGAVRRPSLPGEER
ncbi:hypothetical protein BJF78_22395 [Pseudonocardia sp. CNS-139]|nr:hypothetical protein BJF78_22395 [Pseudonocardia sp. CNS-139]